MRLPPDYQSVLTRLAGQVFGPQAEVVLFGSRLDDAAKGGDIDVLIQLDAPVADKGRLSARYNALLQQKLGMQKFDVLVIDPLTVLEPIHRHALATGVRL